VISFIVPVKNGLQYTRALVESVRAGNPEAPVEWIIVDSGSTDGTLEYCSEIGARVARFRSEPFNYCAAVNAGAEQASGDLWIIANNDVEFRSPGDMARLERLFEEWPLLAVVSPGREAGEAELEFLYGSINGACWAVRPSAFRSWGGMPETMSGYGYDEAFTAFQCWRHGLGIGWITGWDVFHHGSVTFGPLAGNVAPALRRNLSRLLLAMDARDLDRGGSPEGIMRRLVRRELERAPWRLALATAPSESAWLERQGYANARPVRQNRQLSELQRVYAREGMSGRFLGLHRHLAGEGELFPEGVPQVFGVSAAAAARQWLPWLENELLLRPDARVVGRDGWYAVRPDEDTSRFDLREVAECLPSVRQAGPAPPVLMPPLAHKRATLRQRLTSALHAWRHSRVSLPEGW
jgi:GT2 family glycosyltransferase